ncbi:cytochrome c [Leptothrix discophora]|uniref:Cytochrome c n=1 Tax=Leptothrix discophora TaxID=89 RepID=A0ABT9G2H5_LEPDI|nr:cytochrome c [Leptothrix discophora]MDP4300680.1 cytochrome c [Leptothrix discophora]
MSRPFQRSATGWRIGLAVMAVLTVLLLLLAGYAGLLGGGKPAPPGNPTTRDATQAAPSDAAQIARGAYLAQVGNCAGCHTARGGAPLAGGRALNTPYGTVHAGNLTPDPDTGLGRWSADDFWQALHHGRSRDGRRLLPVFPYPSYTQVSRADSDALHAWLRSLAPVRQANRPHALRFPYDTDIAIALWQVLFFRSGDAAQAAMRATSDDPLQRGAYLVEGLGHCAECHAPRNLLGAAADLARGGDMPGEPWHAPSLHPVDGQPQASVEDLVALLRSGQNRLGTASGPMAGVVHRSTQHWTEADLKAAAVYLAQRPRLSAAQAAVADAPADSLALGRQLYDDRCADCHGSDGAGLPGVYPPLAGNPTVLQPVARNLVQVLRHGGFAPVTAANPRPYGMPPQDLDDREVAALVNLMRQSWGNRAAPVSEVDVLRFK